MPSSDRQRLCKTLRLHRDEIERQLLVGRSRPEVVPAEPGAAVLAAALAAALTDALIAEVDAPGALVPTARRHGTLRARQDGTVDALIDEYAALRTGLGAALGARGQTLRTTSERISETADAGGFVHDSAAAVKAPAAAPDMADDDAADLRVAIDAAAGTAAAAFNVERLRQTRALLRGQDHEMRGSLNAIRLAGYVHRQTGADTADVIERHTARMRAGLDRFRHLAAPGVEHALRLDDLPADDLAETCRQEVEAWCEAHPSQPCTAVFANTRIEHLDGERVREAIAGLIGAVAARAGSNAPVHLRMTTDPYEVEIAIVAARPPAGAAPGAAKPAVDWPLVWLLASQTAADHGGRLDPARTDEGAGYRLTLRLAPPARRATSTGAG